MAMDKDRLGSDMLSKMNALGPLATPLQIWTAIAEAIIDEINNFYP